MTKKTIIVPKIKLKLRDFGCYLLVISGDLRYIGQVATKWDKKQDDIEDEPKTLSATEVLKTAVTRVLVK